MPLPTASLLPPQALQQLLPDLSFADASLGRQAAAWRARQGQLLASLAAVQGPSGHHPQPLPPPPPPQQRAVAQELQRSYLQCLQARYSLHVAQMRQHEEAVNRIVAQQALLQVDGNGQAGAAVGATERPPAVASACAAGGSTAQMGGTKLPLPHIGASQPPVFAHAWEPSTAAGGAAVLTCAPARLFSSCLMPLPV